MGLGGGGFISGGFDPTRKPEGAQAIVRDRRDRTSRLKRMRGRERWLFLGFAAAVVAASIATATSTLLA